MRLLIVTQKIDMNDELLGFFYKWVQVFAEHCKFVTAICLQKGATQLPENVKILSLGKEKSAEKGFRAPRLFRIILYSWRFYIYILRERQNYDTVFVHMNPEYVVLGGLFWGMWRKQTALWYTHKAVTLKLRLAELLVNHVFTASSESFRIPSSKVTITGHGIDTDRFCLTTRRNDDGIFRLITVGRIAPIKDYETLIRAIEQLTKKGMAVGVTIIGGVGLSKEQRYFASLQKLIREKQLDNVVHFVGSIPHHSIPERLKTADAFIHMSRTGSLDKAALEAMASGLPVLSSNEAVRSILRDHKKLLTYPEGNDEALSNNITILINMEQVERERLGRSLRETVIRHHSLDKLIHNIMEILAT